ncbi:hypothetical protein HPB51_029200 [Rhipicephalus microplus]|uniref:Uncharacterized protein n=1 Tax=Rhipicephalus microplus TaxID=6941 RepID=A0A9J6CVJ1_RHIMP|nr:hypothetical protein HPB51_029200 [Rhipicephalus microplus]
MPLRWQQPAVALGARERGREGAPPKRARVRDVQHRLRCVGDDRCLGLNPKAVAESVNFRGQQACAGVVKPHKDYTFMFDKVFGEDKNSKYNCERTTKEMLTTLLDGYYCSVSPTVQPELARRSPCWAPRIVRVGLPDGK